MRNAWIVLAVWTVAVVVMAAWLAGCGRWGVYDAPLDMSHGDLSGPCLVGFPTDPGFTCAGKECGGVEIGVVVPLMSDCGHVGQPCCKAVIGDASDMRDADEPFGARVIFYCADDYTYQCNSNRVCGRCP